MNRYESIMISLGVVGEKNFIHEPPEPLTEDGLQALERELGFYLPTDFRNFFTFYHGVDFPRPVVFPLRHPDINEHGGSVGFIYGTVSRSTNSLIYKYKDYIDTDPWGLNYYSGLENIRPFDATLDEEDDEGNRAMRFPTNLLPFGGINSGNMVCVVIGGNNYGQIYYWINMPYVSQSGKGIYAVADSFDEFVHLLKPLPTVNF